MKFFRKINFIKIMKRGEQGGILTYNIYCCNILMPFTVT